MHGTLGSIYRGRDEPNTLRSEIWLKPNLLFLSQQLMLHNNNNWCYTLHNFAWFWVNAKNRVKKWLVHCMITLQSDNCIALHSVGCIERECSEIVGRLKRHQSLARGVPNVPTGPCLVGEGANFVLWGNSWTYWGIFKVLVQFFLSYLAVHSKIKI